MGFFMPMHLEAGKQLVVDTNSELNWGDICKIVFSASNEITVRIDPNLEGKLTEKRQVLLQKVKEGAPIYGVSTGFGASAQRRISQEQAEQLQINLVNYLSCGTGDYLPREASKATVLVHLQALSRAMSGVSAELIKHIASFIENDWAPVIPCEGSLGASGDLVPLAHVAQCYLGKGQVYLAGKDTPVATSEIGVAPYKLKAKEGLSLVNGTSTMTGMCIYNLRRAEFLLELSQIAASWQCLAIHGRPEAFSKAVNQEAKRHSSQARVAASIRTYLEEENYTSTRSVDTNGGALHTERPVQDKYSLRCTPQVLGPVRETLDMVKQWVVQEANSCSDNPIIDDTANIYSGGNFYGGYLSHGMDYMKISLSNVADLIDRQLCVLVDENTNGGLAPNLANWENMSEGERHLHHGLKGLHQSMSAICSEIIQKSFPASVLSRSAESHNQDKISLGMSASMQCHEILEKLFTMSTLQIVSLAQALDIKKISLKGKTSQKLYKLIRKSFPFVEGDCRLDGEIRALRKEFMELSKTEGSAFFENPSI